MTVASASPRPVLLAAGGTGGHLFPAEALASELGRRGVPVELATDERADRYGRAFPARAVHIVSSATITSRAPLALARSAVRLGAGLFQAWRLLGALRPAVVVGFGGYPTFPPLVAAQRRGVPTVLHEQNAVMGRANRALAPRVSVIATSFPDTQHLGAHAAKAVLTGNPVRPAVVAASATPYVPPSEGGQLRLLVFGGSQGARYFSEAMPPALRALPAFVRDRLALVQQARAEDLDTLRVAISDAGVEAEVAPFFTDLPARIAAAHLVVCRSGASSVSELAAIGRPSILVPLPHALDQDQAANGRVLAGAGAAILVPQAELSPERLATELAGLFTAPERLAVMAGAARALGRPDAVARLADLVLHVAAGGGADTFPGQQP